MSVRNETFSFDSGTAKKWDAPFWLFVVINRHTQMVNSIILGQHIFTIGLIVYKQHKCIL